MKLDPTKIKEFGDEANRQAEEQRKRELAANAAKSKLEAAAPRMAGALQAILDITQESRVHDIALDALTAAGINPELQKIAA